MKRYQSLSYWLLLLISCLFCVNSWADYSHIVMLANGATIDSDTDNKTWYQFSLDNNTLNIKEITKLRPSDWLKAVENTSKTNNSSPIFKSEGYTADTTNDALFSTKIINESGLDQKMLTGFFPSVLPKSQLIIKNWQYSFNLDKERYQIYSEYQHQENGALLNGSMTLKLITPKNKSAVMLAPAHNSIYRRQELLWLGDLDSNNYPDLILKRTLLTNEYEYVLVINGQNQAIRIDSDNPINISSSGAEEESITIQHRTETRSLTPKKFGLVAFSLNQESFNDKLSNARKTQLPFILDDRLLYLNDEPLRITFEHIPRFEIQNGENSSEIYNHWGGSVLIKAYFRGQVSVIMEMGELDGGFKLQADLINNQPAIQIYYDPHYNNNLINYWLWDEQQLRFKRWLMIHNQGC
ncbi:MAG: hypothetical protein KDI39_05885 [Pseudomonadales bacterium]|nr:hypothetical protein [Pseudomonadales bacterium]